MHRRLSVLFLLQQVFEVVNVELEISEAFISCQFLMQRDIGFDSVDYHFLQRVFDTVECGVPVFAMTDQLGYE